tara:strand:+ start:397 stop:582 length:186 start_codon:yes stop_codon:yes gene_type:complete
MRGAFVSSIVDITEPALISGDRVSHDDALRSDVEVDALNGGFGRAAASTRSISVGEFFVFA